MKEVFEDRIKEELVQKTSIIAVGCGAEESGTRQLGLVCSSCFVFLPNQAREVEEKTAGSPCSNRLLQQCFVECLSTGDGLDFDDIVALLVDLHVMSGSTNDCS